MLLEWLPQADSIYEHKHQLIFSSIRTSAVFHCTIIVRPAFRMGCHLPQNLFGTSCSEEEIFAEETFLGSARGNNVAHGIVLCGLRRILITQEKGRKVYIYFFTSQSWFPLNEDGGQKRPSSARRLPTDDLHSDSVYDTVQCGSHSCYLVPCILSRSGDRAVCIYETFGSHLLDHTVSPRVERIFIMFDRRTLQRQIVMLRFVLPHMFCCRLL